MSIISIAKDYLNLTAASGNTYGNAGGVSFSYENDILTFTENDGDVFTSDAQDLSETDIETLSQLLDVSPLAYDYLVKTETSGNTLGNSGNVDISYEEGILNFTESDGDIHTIEAADLTDTQLDQLSTLLGAIFTTSTEDDAALSAEDEAECSDEFAEEETTNETSEAAAEETVENSAEETIEEIVEEVAEETVENSAEESAEGTVEETADTNYEYMEFNTVPNTSLEAVNASNQMIDMGGGTTPIF